ncbi:MAG: ABC transporter substrate-binding protein [Spirochaetes bacterium]|nr:ABC transporter substrate-binding protein [Spirochaetota bacterium]
MNKRLLIAILLAAAAGTLFYMAFFRTGYLPKRIPVSVNYDSYSYGNARDAKIIDVATQPNAIFTSESLFHDLILQRQLAADGWKLREHRFRNGRDMLPYTDGRLDVMVLGDIPAYIAMTRSRIGIFAVCRQGYNTIVANRILTPSEIKGRRVGYPPNTTAHFTLDLALHSADLSINDIITIPMPPDEMEAAFRKRSVDMIVSWEPTASAILAIPGSAAISRSEGFSYIAMDIDFAARNPAVQAAVLAAVVRAVSWARSDERNVRTNLIWDRLAAIAFLGSSPVEANAKWTGLMRKETIDNPSFPMLSLDFSDERGIQHRQFVFMKQNGLLPEDASWQRICERVYVHRVPEIIKESIRWQIGRFDYAAEKLYRE